MSNHLQCALIVFLTCAGLGWAGNQTVIPAGDPRIQVLGVWHHSEDNITTIYPGSQLRFSLLGHGHVNMDAVEDGNMRVVVKANGTPVWEGAPHGSVDINAPTSTVSFAICYAATGVQGFDPLGKDAGGAELHFRGITLEQGSNLSAIEPCANKVMMEFIGDSITAGVHIHGRAGSGLTNSDACLTYGALLAESLGAGFRIRGYPGVSCETLADRIPYSRKGIPLERDQSIRFVFLDSGANERVKDRETYSIGMRRTVDAVRSTYPGAKVVLLNFFRMTPNRWPALLALARSYPNEEVVCFDARPFLVGYTDEGIHPDVESHRRLAEALAKFMEPMMVGVR